MTSKEILDWSQQGQGFIGDLETAVDKVRADKNDDNMDWTITTTSRAIEFFGEIKAKLSNSAGYLGVPEGWNRSLYYIHAAEGIAQASWTIKRLKQNLYETREYTDISEDQAEYLKVLKNRQEQVIGELRKTMKALQRTTGM